MPPKNTPQKRDDMRLKILNTTFDLIKKYGITHTSIEKITKACEIGKGTFYIYFDSKEALILALIEKQGQDSLTQFQSILNGREKMSVDEGKEYIRFVVNRDDTVYRYLTREYLQKLERTFPEKNDDIHPSHRVETIRMLFSRIDGVCPDIDYKLIADLMSTYSVAFFHWDDRTLRPDKSDVEKTVYEHLFSLIFIEN